MFNADDMPVFEFKHTDVDGGTNVLRFSTETWPEALERFVQFLKGCGYMLEYKSVGINAEKHFVPSSGLLYEFYPSNESNAEESENPWDVGFPEIDESMVSYSKQKQGLNNYWGDE